MTQAVGFPSSCSSCVFIIDCEREKKIEEASHFGIARCVVIFMSDPMSEECKRLFSMFSFSSEAREASDEIMRISLLASGEKSLQIC